MMSGANILTRACICCGVDFVQRIKLNPVSLRPERLKEYCHLCYNMPAPSGHVHGSVPSLETRQRAYVARRLLDVIENSTQVIKDLSIALERKYKHE